MGLQDKIKRLLSFIVLDEEYSGSTVGLVKKLLKTVVKAFILVFLFQTFIYGNFRIPSSSMNPTLITGDRLIVSKFEYGYSKYSFYPFKFNFSSKILARRVPKYGDIVIVAGDKETDKDFYIKRVIGIPGDNILISNGKVFINGEVNSQKFSSFIESGSVLNENFFNVVEKEETENKKNKSYKILIGDEHSDANNAGVFKVPDGYYFLMGDNRDNSLDSRFDSFGMIKDERIVGKALFVYLSIGEHFKDRIKRIFTFL